MFFSIIQSLLTLILAGLLLINTLAISGWFLRGRGLPQRLCGAFIICFWVMVLIFQVLIFPGVFSLPLVIVCLIPGGIYGWKTAFGETQELTKAFHQALPLIQGCFQRSLMGKIISFLSLFAGGIAFLRIVRAMVAPPLGHDALMYHLVKAGRWVAQGSFVITNEPDHWTYHQWFPYMGDIIYAWAMLPFHGDYLVSLSGILFWLSIPVISYCFLRQWKCERLVSVAGAMCVAYIPTMINTMTCGIVDHMVVSISLFCFYFVNEYQLKKDRRCLILAVVAVALGVGVKVSVLPLAAIVGCICLYDLASAWSGPRVRGFISYFLAGAIVYPMFIVNMIYKGNPLYPMGISIGGVEIFKGNQQLADIFQNKLVPAHVPDVIDIIGEMFIFKAGYVHWPHANLGVGSLIALVIGLGFGYYYSCFHGKLFKYTWLATLFAAIIAVAFFSPSYVAQRSAFLNNSGRLLSPVVVLAVLLIATLPRRWSLISLSIIFAFHLYYDLPRGFCTVDWVGVRILSTIILIATILLAIIFRMMKHRGTTLSLLGVCSIYLIVCLVSGRILSLQFRHNIYARMRVGIDTAYDFFPIGGGRAHMYWKDLDRDEPVKLAVTAGKSFFGHHILRFPLMGTRLQNTVVYVPVSKDGELISRYDTESLKTKTSYEAWHQRLLDENIEYVVCLPPPSIEYHWIITLKHHYELVTVVQGDDAFHYFRVKSKQELNMPENSLPEG